MIFYICSVIITYIVLGAEYYRGLKANYKFTKAELFFEFVVVPLMPVLNLFMVFLCILGYWY